MKVIFEYVTLLIRHPQSLSISKAFCHGSTGTQYDKYRIKEIRINKEKISVQKGCLH